MVLSCARCVGGGGDAGVWGGEQALRPTPFDLLAKIYVRWGKVHVKRKDLGKALEYYDKVEWGARAACNGTLGLRSCHPVFFFLRRPGGWGGGVGGGGGWQAQMEFSTKEVERLIKTTQLDKRKLDAKLCAAPSATPSA